MGPDMEANIPLLSSQERKSEKTREGKEKEPAKQTEEREEVTQRKGKKGGDRGGVLHFLLRKKPYMGQSAYLKIATLCCCPRSVALLASQIPGLFVFCFFF